MPEEAPLYRKEHERKVVAEVKALWADAPGRKRSRGKKAKGVGRTKAKRVNRKAGR